MRTGITDLDDAARPEPWTREGRRRPAAKEMAQPGSAQPRRLLLLLTRFPEPGRAKTRLIPLLGAEGACALHGAMAERTLRRVAPPAAGAWEILVRHEGGGAAAVRAWLGPGPALAPQGSGDLGARLLAAFTAGLAAGAEAVVAIGSDCPALGAGDIADAFRALQADDAVFGPATDGGYWLVGLRRAAGAAARPLFAQIPWGSARVLAASVAAASAAGLAVTLLRTLPDVDRPEDLPVWEKALRDDLAVPSISVVVPALDEEGQIGTLVDTVCAADGVEVLVADGGSRDRTAAVAAGHGARVVHAGRAGRAAQMNAGAAVATGEVLLFLHADTRLPGGWADAVRRTVSDPGVAVGAFSFATDSPRRSLRIIERLANWRGRRLGIVFGDQALFARHGDFEAAGRYPDQPLMEDWELVRRLLRRGRIVVLPQAATTSARRWHARGPWRNSLRNAAITLAYAAGVPPGLLARWYGPRRLRACRPRA